MSDHLQRDGHRMSLYRTYEELKQEYVFYAPRRARRLYRTYEELKQGDEHTMSLELKGLYRTYEELKRT